MPESHEPSSSLALEQPTIATAPVPIAPGLRFYPAYQGGSCYLDAVARAMHLRPRDLRELLADHINRHAEEYFARGELDNLPIFVNALLDVTQDDSYESTVQFGLMRLLQRVILVVHPNGDVLNKQLVDLPEYPNPPLFLFHDNSRRYSPYLYAADTEPNAVLAYLDRERLKMPINNERIEVNRDLVMAMHTTSLAPYTDNFESALEFVFDLARRGILPYFKVMTAQRDVLVNLDDAEARLLTTKTKFDMADLILRLYELIDTKLEMYVQQLQSRDRGHFERNRRTQLETLGSMMDAQIGHFLDGLNGKLSESKSDEKSHHIVGDELKLQLPEEAIQECRRACKKKKEGILHAYEEKFKDVLYPLPENAYENTKEWLHAEVSALTQQKAECENAYDEAVDIYREHSLTYAKSDSNLLDNTQFQILLDSAAGFDMPPRFYLTNEQMQRRLLSIRISYHSRNADGDTLAHVLACYGHTNAFFWLHQRNNKLATTKNSLGVQAIDMQHPQTKETILHATVRSGNTGRVAILLDMDPNLHLRGTLDERLHALDTLIVERKGMTMGVSVPIGGDAEQQSVVNEEPVDLYLAETLLMRLYHQSVSIAESADFQQDQSLDLFKRLLDHGADPIRRGFGDASLLASIRQDTDHGSSKVRKLNEKYLDAITLHLATKAINQDGESNLQQFEKGIKCRDVTPEKQPSVYLQKVQHAVAKFLKDFILTKYNNWFERFQRRKSDRVRRKYSAHFEFVIAIFEGVRCAFSEVNPTKAREIFFQKQLAVGEDPKAAGLTAWYGLQHSPLFVNSDLAGFVAKLLAVTAEMNFDTLRQNQLGGPARMDSPAVNAYWQSKFAEQDKRHNQARAEQKIESDAREAKAEARYIQTEGKLTETKEQLTETRRQLETMMARLDRLETASGAVAAPPTGLNPHLMMAAPIEAAADQAKVAEPRPPSPSIVP